MKNSILLAVICLCSLCALSCADGNKEVKEYPSLHGQITYFQEKHELYSTFPIEKGDIVFAGDDVADRAPSFWLSNIVWASAMVREEKSRER